MALQNATIKNGQVLDFTPALISNDTLHWCTNPRLVRIIAGSTVYDDLASMATSTTRPALLPLTTLTDGKLVYSYAGPSYTILLPTGKLHVQLQWGKFTDNRFNKARPKRDTLALTTLVSAGKTPEVIALFTGDISG